MNEVDYEIGVHDVGSQQQRLFVVLGVLENDDGRAGIARADLLEVGQNTHIVGDAVLLRGDGEGLEVPLTADDHSALVFLTTDHHLQR